MKNTKNTEVDEHRLRQTLKLAERAALHACDHPSVMAVKGAKRGCGACRALLAIRELQDSLNSQPKLFSGI